MSKNNYSRQMKYFLVNILINILYGKHDNEYTHQSVRLVLIIALTAVCAINDLLVQHNKIYYKKFTYTIYKLVQPNRNM